MATKRPKGNKWEYIVKRAKLLSKPVYLIFEDEAEGDAYVARLEAMLDRGVVPPELTGGVEKIVILAELIRSYMNHNTVPPSDVSVLNVIYAEIGLTAITSLSYAWVENWILKMKVETHLAPGTIRHRVGALARCFDYAGRQNIVALVINPIRQLPKRYAQYSARDKQLALAHDPAHEGRTDTSRDRRLMEGEEQKIRDTMGRVKREDKERPMKMKHQAAMELMFDIGLESAMRMRESYTLTLDQVSLKERTIFLDRTKNGSSRQVPMSSVLVKKFEEYFAHVEAGTRGMDDYSFESGRLFPFWDGSLDPFALKELTTLMSGRFRSIFAYSQCDGLTYHDLRHEATSRLFERTNLSEFEIMKITGHSSTRMLARYANLRGSNLAGRLW